MSPVSHTTKASAWGLRKITKTVNDDSSGRGTFVAQVGSFVTNKFSGHPYLLLLYLVPFTYRQWKFNPYPTAFPYGNGMVLHFYQQQESSMTKTVHKVINKRLKTYV